MQIEHQPQQQRFVVQLEAGQAVLEYRLLPDNGVNFNYTYVPPALRGRGIAEKLVRAGLAWARGQDYRIEASCWYVQRFLRSRG